MVSGDISHSKILFQDWSFGWWWPWWWCGGFYTHSNTTAAPQRNIAQESNKTICYCSRTKNWIEWRISAMFMAPWWLRLPSKQSLVPPMHLHFYWAMAKGLKFGGKMCIVAQSDTRQTNKGSQSNLTIILPIHQQLIVAQHVRASISELIGHISAQYDPVLQSRLPKNKRSEGEAA